MAPTVPAAASSAAPTAPLEERPAAIREPAAGPRPPARPSRRLPEYGTGARAQEAFGGLASAASAGSARALAWSRAGAARARDLAVAAYTSPRTRRARSTATAYTRRAAAGAVELARRGSSYAREQYDRDPRRTLVVAGIATAAFVLLLVLLVSAIGSGGDSAVDAGEGGSQQPGLGTPLAMRTEGTSAREPSATPTATAAPPLPGTPYNETAIVAALQARGLAAAPSNEAFACDNPGTTPKSYRVSAGGAEQRIVLLVYPDAAAFGRDWALTGGRPQYRRGSCGAGAAVVYFNINAMLIFPQTNNAGIQAQVSDAFLALP